MERRTARPVWISFFLGGITFESLVFVGVVFLFGGPVDSFLRLQATAFPASYIVAAGAAAAMFLVVRSRNAAAAAAATAWTEPMDLETLRRRINPDEDPAETRSRLRRILDEQHEIAQRSQSAVVTGIAGGARRR